MKGVWLERLTWEEAERALKEFPVVVLPLGAQLKEHGRHLPLNNDWLLAEELARRIAEDCEVLILPTLGLSYYPAFREYPGTVSLGFSTAKALILETVLSLSRFGARKFYCLNTGISTLKVLDRVSWELIERHGVRLEYLDIREALSATRAEVETQEGGTHADEVETSMMLYLMPEVVRLEHARKDYVPGKGPLTRDPGNPDGVFSPSGTWGDPSLATLRKGGILVEALIEYLVKFLKAFQDPGFV